MALKTSANDSTASATAGNDQDARRQLARRQDDVDRQPDGGAQGSLEAVCNTPGVGKPEAATKEFLSGRITPRRAPFRSQGAGPDAERPAITFSRATGGGMCNSGAQQSGPLVNLGSPDSPSVPDVRRYLDEFLMDGRVIDTPWLLRRFVVGMILIKRPAESGHAYEKIWTKDGSPLVVTSKRVQAALQKRLPVPVALAMRYQNPSIESAVKKLAGQGATDVLLIPLFPHYAMSSYETAVVRVQEVAKNLSPQMKLTVQPPYYDHPDFIAALVASAADFLRTEFDHLLFSTTGSGRRCKSDPTGVIASSGQLL
jgi:hypothetical protein